MQPLQKAIAKLIAYCEPGQPKVGSKVFFSCASAKIPANPIWERSARTIAISWAWIDKNNQLTRKGFKRLETFNKELRPPPPTS